jgi:ABC-2 type transport system permease protein
MTRANPTFSLARIYAMVLRHYYVLRGSWTRLLELAYWPTIQMVMWGFLTQFLAANTSYIAQAFGVLLAAFLLWDLLFRSQLGVSVSFLEEMWSRNLGHIFVSPLRPTELMVTLMVMSVIRTAIGLLPASFLAIAFYGYSIYSLGWPLLGFYLNLVFFGWGMGLAICGFLIRYGMGAESLAWLAGFIILPISGIYYPIAVLPTWLQPVAWCLPSSYVFEGLRAAMVEGAARWDLMAGAAALNVLYVLGGGACFLGFFRAARQRGQLLQMGE